MPKGKYTVDANVDVDVELDGYDSSAITVEVDGYNSNIDGSQGKDSLKVEGDSFQGQVDLDEGKNAVIIEGVNADFNLNTGNEADKLTVKSTAVNTEVDADLGGGSNSVKVDADTVDMDLVTGDEADKLSVKGSSFSGDIDLGSGDNKIDIKGDLSSASLTTAAGEDKISIKGDGFSGIINTGAGEDRIDIKGDNFEGTVDAGAGEDRISVKGESFDGSVDGGADADRIDIKGTDFTGTATGGDGGDKINVKGKFFNGTVEGGAGDDEITVSSKSVEGGTIGAGGSVAGGAGDDTIVVKSKFSTIEVDGGAGENTIIIKGREFSGSITSSDGGVDTVEVDGKNFNGEIVGNNNTVVNVNKATVTTLRLEDVAEVNLNFVKKNLEGDFQLINTAITGTDNEDVVRLIDSDGALVDLGGGDDSIKASGDVGDMTLVGVEKLDIVDEDGLEGAVIDISASNVGTLTLNDADHELTLTGDAESVDLGSGNSVITITENFTGTIVGTGDNSLIVADGVDISGATFVGFNSYSLGDNVTHAIVVDEDDDFTAGEGTAFSIPDGYNGTLDDTDSVIVADDATVTITSNGLGEIITGGAANITLIGTAALDTSFQGLGELTLEGSGFGHKITDVTGDLTVLNLGENVSLTACDLTVLETVNGHAAGAESLTLINHNAEFDILNLESLSVDNLATVVNDNDSLVNFTVAANVNATVNDAGAVTSVVGQDGSAESVTLVGNGTAAITTTDLETLTVDEAAVLNNDSDLTSVNGDSVGAGEILTLQNAFNGTLKDFSTVTASGTNNTLTLDEVSDLVVSEAATITTDGNLLSVTGDGDSDITFTNNFSGTIASVDDLVLEGTLNDIDADATLVNLDLFNGGTTTVTDATALLTIDSDTLVTVVLDGAVTSGDLTLTNVQNLTVASDVTISEDGNLEQFTGNGTTNVTFTSAYDGAVSNVGSVEVAGGTITSITISDTPSIIINGQVTITDLNGALNSVEGDGDDIAILVNDFNGTATNLATLDLDGAANTVGVTNVASLNLDEQATITNVDGTLVTITGDGGSNLTLQSSFNGTITQVDELTLNGVTNTVVSDPALVDVDLGTDSDLSISGATSLTTVHGAGGDSTLSLTGDQTANLDIQNVDILNFVENITVSSDADLDEINGDGDVVLTLNSDFDGDISGVVTLNLNGTSYDIDIDTDLTALNMAAGTNTVLTGAANLTNVDGGASLDLDGLQPINLTTTNLAAISVDNNITLTSDASLMSVEANNQEVTLVNDFGTAFVDGTVENTDVLELQGAANFLRTTNVVEIEVDTAATITATDNVFDNLRGDGSTAVVIESDFDGAVQQVNDLTLNGINNNILTDLFLIDIDLGAGSSATVNAATNLAAVDGGVELSLTGGQTTALTTTVLSTLNIVNDITVTADAALTAVSGNGTAEIVFTNEFNGTATDLALVDLEGAVNVITNAVNVDAVNLDGQATITADVSLVAIDGDNDSVVILNNTFSGDITRVQDLTLSGLANDVDTDLSLTELTLSSGANATVSDAQNLAVVNGTDATTSLSLDGMQTATLQTVQLLSLSVDSDITVDNDANLQSIEGNGDDTVTVENDFDAVGATITNATDVILQGSSNDFGSDAVIDNLTLTTANASATVDSAAALQTITGAAGNEIVNLTGNGTGLISTINLETLKVDSNVVVSTDGNLALLDGSVDGLSTSTAQITNNYSASVNNISALTLDGSSNDVTADNDLTTLTITASGGTTDLADATGLTSITAAGGSETVNLTNTNTAAVIATVALETLTTDSDITVDNDTALEDVSGIAGSESVEVENEFSGVVSNINDITLSGGSATGVSITNVDIVNVDGHATITDADGELDTVNGHTPALNNELVDTVTLVNVFNGEANNLSTLTAESGGAFTANTVTTINTEADAVITNTGVDFVYGTGTEAVTLSNDFTGTAQAILDLTLGGTANNVTSDDELDNLVLTTATASATINGATELLTITAVDGTLESVTLNGVNNQTIQTTDLNTLIVNNNIVVNNDDELSSLTGTGTTAQILNNYTGSVSNITDLALDGAINDVDSDATLLNLDVATDSTTTLSDASNALLDIDGAAAGTTTSVDLDGTQTTAVNTSNVNVLTIDSDITITADSELNSVIGDAGAATLTVTFVNDYTGALTDIDILNLEGANNAVAADADLDTLNLTNANTTTVSGATMLSDVNGSAVADDLTLEDGSAVALDVDQVETLTLGDNTATTFASVTADNNDLSTLNLGANITVTNFIADGALTELNLADNATLTLTGAVNLTTLDVDANITDAVVNDTDARFDTITIGTGAVDAADISSVTVNNAVNIDTITGDLGTETVNLTTNHNDISVEAVETLGIDQDTRITNLDGALTTVNGNNGDGLDDNEVSFVEDFSGNISGIDIVNVESGANSEFTDTDASLVTLNYDDGAYITVTGATNLEFVNGGSPETTETLVLNDSAVKPLDMNNVEHLVLGDEGVTIGAYADNQLEEVQLATDSSIYLAFDNYSGLQEIRGGYGDESAYLYGAENIGHMYGPYNHVVNINDLENLTIDGDADYGPTETFINDVNGPELDNLNIGPEDIVYLQNGTGDRYEDDEALTVSGYDGTSEALIIGDDADITMDDVEFLGVGSGFKYNRFSYYGYTYTYARTNAESVDVAVEDTDASLDSLLITGDSYADIDGASNLSYIGELDTDIGGYGGDYNSVRVQDGIAGTLDVNDIDELTLGDDSTDAYGDAKVFGDVDLDDDVDALILGDNTTATVTSSPTTIGAGPGDDYGLTSLTLGDETNLTIDGAYNLTTLEIDHDTDVEVTDVDANFTEVDIEGDGDLVLNNATNVTTISGSYDAVEAYSYADVTLNGHGNSLEVNEINSLTIDGDATTITFDNFKYTESVAMINDGSVYDTVDSVNLDFSTTRALTINGIETINVYAGRNVDLIDGDTSIETLTLGSNADVSIDDATNLTTVTGVAGVTETVELLDAVTGATVTHIEDLTVNGTTDLTTDSNLTVLELGEDASADIIGADQLITVSGQDDDPDNVEALTLQTGVTTITDLSDIEELTLGDGTAQTFAAISSDTELEALTLTSNTIFTYTGPDLAVGEEQEFELDPAFEAIFTVQADTDAALVIGNGTNADLEITDLEILTLGNNTYNEIVDTNDSLTSLTLGETSTTYLDDADNLESVLGAGLIEKLILDFATDIEVNFIETIEVGGEAGLPSDGYTVKLDDSQTNSITDLIIGENSDVIFEDLGFGVTPHAGAGGFNVSNITGDDGAGYETVYLANQAVNVTISEVEEITTNGTTSFASVDDQLVKLNVESGTTTISNAAGLETIYLATGASVILNGLSTGDITIIGDVTDFDLGTVGVNDGAEESVTLLSPVDSIVAFENIDILTVGDDLGIAQSFVLEGVDSDLHTVNIQDGASLDIDGDINLVNANGSTTSVALETLIVRDGDATGFAVADIDVLTLGDTDEDYDDNTVEVFGAVVDTVTNSVTELTVADKATVDFDGGTSLEDLEIGSNATVDVSFTGAADLDEAEFSIGDESTLTLSGTGPSGLTTLDVDFADDVEAAGLRATVNENTTGGDSIVNVEIGNNISLTLNNASAATNFDGSAGTEELILSGHNDTFTIEDIENLTVDNTATTTTVTDNGALVNLTGAAGTQVVDVNSNDDSFESVTLVENLSIENGVGSIATDFSVDEHLTTLTVGDAEDPHSFYIGNGATNLATLTGTAGGDETVELKESAATLATNQIESLKVYEDVTINDAVGPNTLDELIVDEATVTVNGADDLATLTGVDGTIETVTVMDNDNTFTTVTEIEDLTVENAADFSADDALTDLTVGDGVTGGQTWNVSGTTSNLDTITGSAALTETVTVDANAATVTSSQVETLELADSTDLTTSDLVNLEIKAGSTVDVVSANTTITSVSGTADDANVNFEVSNAGAITLDNISEISVSSTTVLADANDDLTKLTYNADNIGVTVTSGGASQLDDITGAAGVESLTLNVNNTDPISLVDIETLTVTTATTINDDLTDDGDGATLADGVGDIVTLTVGDGATTQSFTVNNADSLETLIGTDPTGVETVDVNGNDTSLNSVTKVETLLVENETTFASDDQLVSLNVGDGLTDGVSTKTWEITNNTDNLATVSGTAGDDVEQIVLTSNAGPGADQTADISSTNLEALTLGTNTDLATDGELETLSLTSGLTVDVVTGGVSIETVNGVGGVTETVNFEDTNASEIDVNALEVIGLSANAELTDDGSLTTVRGDLAGVDVADVDILGNSTSLTSVIDVVDLTIQNGTTFTTDASLTDLTVGDSVNGEDESFTLSGASSLTTITGQVNPGGLGAFTETVTVNGNDDSLNTVTEIEDLTVEIAADFSADESLTDLTVGDGVTGGQTWNISGTTSNLDSITGSAAATETVTVDANAAAVSSSLVETLELADTTDLTTSDLVNLDIKAGSTVDVVSANTSIVTVDGIGGTANVDFNVSNAAGITLNNISEIGVASNNTTLDDTASEALTQLTYNTDGISVTVASTFGDVTNLDDIVGAGGTETLTFTGQNASTIATSSIEDLTLATAATVNDDLAGDGDIVDLEVAAGIYTINNADTLTTVDGDTSSTVIINGNDDSLDTVTDVATLTVEKQADFAADDDLVTLTLGDGAATQTWNVSGSMNLLATVNGTSGTETVVLSDNSADLESNLIESLTVGTTTNLDVDTVLTTLGVASGQTVTVDAGGNSIVNIDGAGGTETVNFLVENNTALDVDNLEVLSVVDNTTITDDGSLTTLNMNTAVVTVDNGTALTDVNGTTTETLTLLDGNLGAMTMDDVQTLTLGDAAAVAQQDFATITDGDDLTSLTLQGLNGVDATINATAASNLTSITGVAGSEDDVVTLGVNNNANITITEVDELSVVSATTIADSGDDLNDLILTGAGITVTVDGGTASTLDMITGAGGSESVTLKDTNASAITTVNLETLTINNGVDTTITDNGSLTTVNFDSATSGLVIDGGTGLTDVTGSSNETLTLIDATGNVTIEAVADLTVGDTEAGGAQIFGTFTDTNDDLTALTLQGSMGTSLTVGASEESNITTITGTALVEDTVVLENYSASSITVSELENLTVVDTATINDTGDGLEELTVTDASGVSTAVNGGLASQLGTITGAAGIDTITFTGSNDDEITVTDIENLVIVDDVDFTDNANIESITGTGTEVVEIDGNGTAVSVDGIISLEVDEDTTITDTSAVATLATVIVDEATVTLEDVTALTTLTGKVGTVESVILNDDPVATVTATDIDSLELADGVTATVHDANAELDTLVMGDNTEITISGADNITSIVENGPAHTIIINDLSDNITSVEVNGASDVTVNNVTNVNSITSTDGVAGNVVTVAGVEQDGGDPVLIDSVETVNLTARLEDALGTNLEIDDTNGDVLTINLSDETGGDFAIIHADSDDVDFHLDMGDGDDKVIVDLDDAVAAFQGTIDGGDGSGDVIQLNYDVLSGVAELSGFEKFDLGNGGLTIDLDADVIGQSTGSVTIDVDGAIGSTLDATGWTQVGGAGIDAATEIITNGAGTVTLDLTDGAWDGGFTTYTFA